MINQAIHHPVFSKLPLRWSSSSEPNFIYDFLGVKTNPHFIIEDHKIIEQQLACNISVHYPPPINEEYFEYIDIFESILAAEHEFTMIELGAGYGRWLVRAVAALRQISDMPYRLVAAEAEPQHFNWLIQHFKNNKIDPDKHLLINKAVSSHDGEVWFTVGDPVKHYGQAIVESGTYFSPDFPTQRAQRVPCISLKTILNDYNLVDIIDLDVQGAEFEVLSSARDDICRKVKRIHIGTHGKIIEENLRKMFCDMGWIKNYDFSLDTDVETEFGPVHFYDGVQSWLNPSFKNQNISRSTNDCNNIIVSTDTSNQLKNKKYFNDGLRSKLL